MQTLENEGAVVVLCVARKSVYKSLGVECYDIDRDARTFAGKSPIVAHPPCRAWSAFCAHQSKPVQGEKELGPMCVQLLKSNGGILEHPAHSRLWDHCGLPKPGMPEVEGLWSIAVNQSWWGDRRTKKTWLLFAHIDQSEVDLPFRLHDPTNDREQWNTMSRNTRAATPEEMARWLIKTASRARITQSSYTGYSTADA